MKKARTRTLTTKVNRGTHRAVRKKARAAGQRPSEYVREALEKHMHIKKGSAK